MKRPLDQIIQRKEELVSELSGLEKLYNENVREELSRLWIPTEIWKLIFDQIESDNARLWLNLLTTRSVPEEWKDAIRKRTSLSFPALFQKSYNLEKVLRLLQKFPCLKKLKIACSRDFIHKLESPLLANIEEISFYNFPGMRVRTNKELQRPGLNILANITRLDLMGLACRERLLSIMPIENKKRIISLKVDKINQQELELFPLLETLVLNFLEKGIHLDKNLSLNKLHVLISSGLPKISSPRDMEIQFSTSVTNYLYRGNICIHGNGITGQVTLILTADLSKPNPDYYSDVLFAKTSTTFVYEGRMENGKWVGSFTRRKIGSEKVKTFNKMHSDKHSIWFPSR